ncbi:MAG: alkaline phosphatase family protein [Actinomycetales bacterium]
MPTPAATTTATASAQTTAAAASGGAAVPVAAPCQGLPAPQQWHHVVWIWFENKPSDEVVGSNDAPYFTQMAARCGAATRYHGVTHPSLPNYIAATSGSTAGIHDDRGPDAHPLPGPSLFQQINDSSREWRSYEDSMPSPCATSNAGDYAVKHNPAAYYLQIRQQCHSWDVGIAALQQDAATGRLPAFAFVTPDMCHDMHSCPIQDGDAWLRQWLPVILSGPDYQRGDTAVLITFDEDDRLHGNEVALIAISPSTTPGDRLATAADHYALLGTTEQLLGLPPLGHAAGARSLASLLGAGSS